MTRLCGKSLWALVVVLIGGCAASSLPDGTPAVIVDADAASRAELKAVVQTAMNGASVTLAEDALTTTSLISIGHSAPRGIDAPPATGRLLGRGEQFRLLLDGGQCFLKQETTGLRFLLLDTKCAAETTDP